MAAHRIYVDHGLTGTNRERPGLREALAACRDGDTLVVTKLDRLARSLPDARAIADELTARQVRLSVGGSVYDPHDAVGRLLFNVLAMVAEFEADLIRLRTKEGMRVAKAKGRLRGPPVRRRRGWVQRRVIRSWCHRTIVAGVMIRCRWPTWDSNRVSAANTARSAHDRRGRWTWRRNTVTSCRRTKISAFFDRELRAKSPNQAMTCRKMR